MNPTSSKLDSNVAINPICGFISIDNLTFNKTITCHNLDYIVTITFKANDSDLQKKTFLNNYSNDVENTVKIAINLGLGSIKGPTQKKSTRDFTITTLKFQYENDVIKSSKIKTKKNGEATVTPFKSSSIYNLSDSEIKRAKKQQKINNLRLIQEIYERANSSFTVKNKIVEHQNQQHKIPLNVVEPEKKKPIDQKNEYQLNQSEDNKNPSVEISLKPKKNIKADKNRCIPIQTLSTMGPQIEIKQQNNSNSTLNDDEYSNFIREYDKAIRFYIKDQADLASGNNPCELNKYCNAEELKKFLSIDILENFFQILKDRDMFIASFKESNHYKKEEAKIFIEKNNVEILEVLVSFINKFKLELDKYMDNENNKLLDLSSIANSWSISTSVTPHYDNLTKLSPSPIKDPIAFIDCYRKNKNFDSLNYPYTHIMGL